MFYFEFKRTCSVSLTYLIGLELPELKEEEYSYKPISTPKKTAKSTAVTTNIELASSPEDFKSENFLTFTS